MKTFNSTMIRFVAIALVLILTGVSAPALPRCEGQLPRYLFEEHQEQTLIMLKAKQFAALQARLDGFLSAYSSGKLSDEELNLEFQAFNRWGPFLTILIEEWIEKYPKSFAAHQAMSIQVSAIAWRDRGSALGKDTSHQQMEAFYRLLKESQEWARKASKLHPKPILAYEQMVSNAMALNEDDGGRLPHKARGMGSFKNQWDPLNPRPYAKRLLDESLRIQPDNVIVRQAYIHALAPRWGGSTEALQAYTKASSHPGLAADRLATVAYTATLEIASDYWFDKQYEPAVQTYLEAAKLCKLNQPFVDIARIRIIQGKYAEALAAADKALALVSDSHDGRRLRACALRGLGRHEEAVKILVELMPEKDADALFMLGEYYANGQGGLKQDIKRARYFFSLAGRAGDERALKRAAEIPI